MKRSEMLFKLAEYKYEKDPLFYDNEKIKWEDFPYQHAQGILNEVGDLLYIAEQNGMLPPKLLLKKTGRGCLCTMREGCPECDNINEYYENKWEPE